MEEYQYTKNTKGYQRTFATNFEIKKFFRWNRLRFWKYSSGRCTVTTQMNIAGPSKGCAFLQLKKVEIIQN